jgi:ElaB/YqjD/DUF883 family membrane-anchored ribosome-binding protein
MDRPNENNAGEGMGNTVRRVGEAASSAAQRMTESLEQGRATLGDMQALISERARECMRTTDTYVRDNPWQAVGFAAGLGLIIGLLLGRR